MYNLDIKQFTLIVPSVQYRKAQNFDGWNIEQIGFIQKFDKENKLTDT